MGALQTFYKSKIITVEPLVFLSSLSRFMYVPIIEQYYYHYYGVAILKDTAFEFPKGSYCINSSLIDLYKGSNNSYKQDETLSNDLVIYTSLTSQIPAILIAVLLGPLTDRYGRKLGILVPATGYLIEACAAILIIYYGLNPYFFIGTSAITGLMGGHISLIAACYSYAADVSSLKWRSFRIGAVEATSAFGKLSGQLSSGFWLSAVHCNFIPLMIFYSGVTAAAILYALCIPESYTKEERMKLLSKNEGTFKKYAHAVRLYCTNFSKVNTYMLYIITLSLGIAVLNMLGSYHISVYFLKAIPFEFNPIQISYYQALRSASQGLANLLFFFFAIFSIKDSVIILLGFLVNGSGNLLTGFATTTWEIYAISAFQGIEGTIFSACRGLASKLVESEQQGALFSIIASLESFAAVVGSTVWSYVFPITLDHNMKPGTTFMIISAFGFAMVPVTLLLILIEVRRHPKRQVSIQATGPSKYSPDITAYTSKYDERDPLLQKKLLPGGSIN